MFNEIPKITLECADITLEVTDWITQVQQVIQDNMFVDVYGKLGILIPQGNTCR